MLVVGSVAPKVFVQVDTHALVIQLLLQLIVKVTIVLVSFDAESLNQHAVHEVRVLIVTNQVPSQVAEVCAVLAHFASDQTWIWIELYLSGLNSFHLAFAQEFLCKPLFGHGSYFLFVTLDQSLRELKELILQHFLNELVLNSSFA